jgi:hypothetical protein
LDLGAAVAVSHAKTNAKSGAETGKSYWSTRGRAGRLAASRRRPGRSPGWHDPCRQSIEDAIAAVTTDLVNDHARPRS